jgi:diguanylate cyclase (GGDEF)-like protein
MHALANSLTWVDNRTLVCCQLLVCFVYACTFFGMKRIHPNLRGAGTLGLGFAGSFVGAFLVASHDNTSLLVSVVVAHVFLLFAAICFYRGMLLFFHSPRNLRVAWIVSALTIVGLAYFTLAHNDMSARILIRSIAFTYFRCIAAIEIFRQAKGRTFFKSLGLFISTFAVIGIVRIFLIPIFSTHSPMMREDPVQTANLALGVVFTCTLGVLFLLMLCGELVALVQVQTQLDPLAGCLNRRGIEQNLIAELKHIARTGQPLAIALIDVDAFKAINDTRGHAAGDSVLRGVASTASARLRTRDHFGRYGGDEFLMILPQTSGENALNVTGRIHWAIKEFFAGEDSAVTLSIGVTEAFPGESFGSVMERADKALYEAKRGGRNCTRLVHYDPRAVEEESRAAPAIAMQI